MNKCHDQGQYMTPHEHGMSAPPHEYETPTDWLGGHKSEAKQQTAPIHVLTTFRMSSILENIIIENKLTVKVSVLSSGLLNYF